MGAPLKGGEKLIRTDRYQDDHNVREYARIVSLMAQVRDTLLYHFEENSRFDWLSVTQELAMQGVKTKDAYSVDRRSVLSTMQVYDYVASGRRRRQPDYALFGRSRAGIKVFGIC